MWSEIKTELRIFGTWLVMLYDSAVNDIKLNKEEYVVYAIAALVLLSGTYVLL